MVINRNNYEAYLLDYLENTISPQDELLLLKFLDENSDLKPMLDADVSLSLLNDTPKVYLHKEKLRKHPAEEFHLPKTDFLFIKKHEDGLLKEEESELLLLHPDERELNEASKIYSQVKLRRDKSVCFIEKLTLKRSALFSRYNLRTINRVASIAVVILLSTAVWFMQDNVLDNSNAILSEKVEHFNQQPRQLASTEPKVLENKKIFQKPLSKDSLMKIANDPMGKAKRKTSVNKKVIRRKEKQQHIPKMIALSGVSIDKRKEINAYEHGLNVMLPQYMSNNILRRELAVIYGQIESDGSDSPKMLALLEGGAKVLNFLSNGTIGVDKYYDKNGNVTGYRVAGSTLEVQHNAR